MKARITSCLAVCLLMAACASTKVTNVERNAENQKIARPARVYVYDFAATPEAVPADFAYAGQTVEQKEASSEQIAAGREMGALVAKMLIADIREMGLQAEHGSPQVAPQAGDLVLKGYFLSIDEGSAAKRIAIGFGSGSSKLETAVEGYLVTAEGLRKLGSGTVSAGGAKGPGAAVPLAVTIATANPIGLVVSSGVKAHGELSGRNKLEGRAKQTAEEISKLLRTRFEQQGWI